MAVTGSKFGKSLKNNARPWAAILMIIVLVLTLSGCDLFESKNTTTGVSTAMTTTTSSATPTSLAIPTGASASTLVNQTTSSPTTLPTTITPTTTTPTSSAMTTSSAMPTMTTTTGVTEQRMGFVISASATGTQSIGIDYVEFYTGDEAIAKAREDGSDVVYFDPALGRYVIDNDYYIRNNNPLIRTFPLASGCLIKMLPDMGGSEPTDTVTYAELRTRLAERKRLMIINVVNGSVTWMEEFFTP